MKTQKSTTSYYRERLRDELVYRIEKNSRYSLRSLASALGINSGALSQILSGKRAVSTKLVERIFQFLELSPIEQKKFLESVLAEKASLKRVSPRLRQKLTSLPVARDSAVSVDRSIGLEEFRIIADWYHTAILELTFSKNFKSDSKWIANALGLSEMEAKLAIERLIKLELLEESEQGQKKTSLHLETKDKSKTSLFLRRRQKQILEKAAYSLENDPIEERNHSSLTICIDPVQLPEAKLMIQKFMWELSQHLAKKKPERVYEINVNLFPVQKPQT